MFWLDFWLSVNFLFTDDQIYKYMIPPLTHLNDYDNFALIAV